jgi:hypothetical protein
LSDIRSLASDLIRLKDSTSLSIADLDLGLRFAMNAIIERTPSLRVALTWHFPGTSVKSKADYGRGMASPAPFEFDECPIHCPNSRRR